MANNNFGVDQNDDPTYEEVGAGLGQEDGRPASGADPQRENQDEGSQSSEEDQSTGARGGYGGTSPESNRTETEGGQDMQRGGSWRPDSDPATGAYQEDADDNNDSTSVSADAARFDKSDVGVSADDLVEPGQTARGL